MAMASLSAMSVADLKEERRRAFEEVGVALEAISVKSLMEFKGRIEVPRPVESVAVASVCMVARVDDTVQVGPDGLPPRTWAAAQANMAKPGHFVNSLRQFPYAVDSGRMPDVNVYAARQCLEDVSPEHLANEAMALRLHDWIHAAWRYCEVVQMLRLQTSVSGPQTQSQLKPATNALRDGFARGTPPSSPEPQRESSRKAAPLEANGEKPGRSSVGSNISGSNSIFGRSPIADPSPSADSVRSSRPSSGTSGGQALGGGSKRNSAVGAGPAARRNQDTTSSTFRVTPSGSPSSAGSRTPISQRASPLQPSKVSGGQQRTPAGYPQAPRSNIGIEDWQQKLEQMHREARELKAMEGQLKWAMKRDEEKQRRIEAAADAKEVTKWRQEQAKELTQCGVDRKRTKAEQLTEENRLFQEFKRMAKVKDAQLNTRLITEEYVEKKDESLHTMEQRRTEPGEARKLIIDANLEKYDLIAMYNVEESRREKMEQAIARNEAEDATLGLQMLEARKARDAALQSLEFVKSQQRVIVPADNHIPTRPFVPNTAPH